MEVRLEQPANACFPILVTLLGMIVDAHPKINVLLFVSMIALPCMVGMAVLAGPVMQLIFHDSSKLASNLLLFGSSTIIVYSLSSITTSVLQGIDRLFVPMKHCAISLVLYVLTTYIVLRYFEWSVYGLIVSMFIFGANNTILNFIALKKYLKLKAFGA